MIQSGWAGFLVIRLELQNVASQRLIHVTTTGRKTGKLHTVELWFAVKDGKVFLSHEGSETDWMKNIRHSDRVSFEIAGKSFTGRACTLENGSEEAWDAEVALYEKYYGKASKEMIEDWFSLSRLYAWSPCDSAYSALWSMGQIGSCEFWALHNKAEHLGTNRGTA